MWVLLLLVCGVVLFAPAQLVGGEPDPDVLASGLRLEAELTADGHATFRQRASFSFARENTSIEMGMQVLNGERFDISSVSVTDPETGDSVELSELAATGNVSPMTYEAFTSNGSLRLRLHIPVQANARRDVDVTYTAHDAVRVYTDVASCFLILPSASYGTDGFEMIVTAERKISEGRVYAFGSDDLQAAFDRQTSSFHVHDDRIEPGEPISIQYLLPVSVFPDAVNVYDEEAYDRLLAEKDIVAQADMRNRFFQMVLPGMSTGALLLAPVLLLVLWLFSSRALISARRRRSAMSVPGELHPSLAGMLLHQRTTGRELAASLYHLASIGCVRIDQHSLIRVWPEDRLDELPEYDRFLLRWLLFRVGDGQRIYLPDIASTARAAGSSDFRHTFGVFRRLLRTAFRRAGLSERMRLMREKTAAFVFAGIYSILSGAAVLVTGSLHHLFLFIPVAAFLLLAVRLRPLSPYGTEQLVQIKLFRSALRMRDPSMILPPPLEEWSRCFPYAVATGTVNQFLDQTGRMFTLEEMRQASLFASYGMTIESGDEKATVLQRFRTLVRENTAVLLTVVLYLHGDRNRRPPTDATKLPEDRPL